MYFLGIDISTYSIIFIENVHVFHYCCFNMTRRAIDIPMIADRFIYVLVVQVCVVLVKDVALYHLGAQHKSIKQ